MENTNRQMELIFIKKWAKQCKEKPDCKAFNELPFAIKTAIINGDFDDGNFLWDIVTMIRWVNEGHTSESIQKFHPIAMKLTELEKKIIQEQEQNVVCNNPDDLQEYYIDFVDALSNDQKGGEAIDKKEDLFIEILMKHLDHMLQADYSDLQKKDFPRCDEVTREKIIDETRKNDELLHIIRYISKNAQSITESELEYILKYVELLIFAADNDEYDVFDALLGLFSPIKNKGALLCSKYTNSYFDIFKNLLLRRTPEPILCTKYVFKIGDYRIGKNVSDNFVKEILITIFACKNMEFLRQAYEFMNKYLDENKPYPYPYFEEYSCSFTYSALSPFLSLFIQALEEPRYMNILCENLFNIELPPVENKQEISYLPISAAIQKIQAIIESSSRGFEHHQEKLLVKQ